MTSIQCTYTDEGCGDCGQSWKDISEFCKSSRVGPERYGRHCYCKDCRKLYRKARELGYVKKKTKSTQKPTLVLGRGVRVCDTCGVPQVEATAFKPWKNGGIRTTCNSCLDKRTYKPIPPDMVDELDAAVDLINELWPKLRSQLKGA